VIESLLMSKPVIGSNIGGIPELVIDNETGLIFEAGNSDELRVKILRLWNDEFYAEQLGKNARIYAEGKVNFKTHWNILNNIFDQLPIPLETHKV
jgi:glycosyltransferase involved in cell wall biosynthesis